MDARISPTLLVAARIELHWAAQIVAAAADAHLPKRADDSHTAMRWDPTTSTMVGEAAALRVSDLSVTVGGDRLELAGKTLAEAMAWADQRFAPGTPMHARDYDMPVKDGDRFVAHPAALAELARWYDLGLDALATATASAARAAPILIWPHHFDLGTIVYLDATGDRAQIGLGLSPGDTYYAEPYLYVTPYPIAKDASFAELPSGAWRRDGWTGAVLRGSEIAGGADPHAFLRAAIAAARAVIPAAS